MNICNITAGIRVDRASNRGSVIDVIRIVNPNLDSGNASLTLTRLTTEHPGLTARCSSIKINDTHRPTPCADAATLVEIIWLLPGKAAREFRRTSANTVCRVLGGDLSLVDEIEARHHALQGSDEGRAVQEFMLAGSDNSGDSVQVTKRIKSSLPDELQLATVEQQSAYFASWLAERNAVLLDASADRKMTLQKRQFDNVSYFMSELTRQNILDPALRMAMIDSMKNIVTHDATSTALVAVAVAEAPPVHDFQTVAGWLLKFNPSPEYQKTSFTSKMGIAVSNAYRVKHGHPNTSKTYKHVNGEVRPVMQYNVIEDGDILEAVFQQLNAGAV